MSSNEIILSPLIKQASIKLFLTLLIKCGTSNIENILLLLT
jgi:hypothetical protein